MKYTKLGGRINVTMQLKWNWFETACRLMKYIGDRMTLSSHCHCPLIVIVLNLFKIILFVYRISNVMFSVFYQPLIPCLSHFRQEICYLQTYHIVFMKRMANCQNITGV